MREIKNLLLAVAVILQALLGAQVLAQDFPTKPIRLIVPYASGGSSDILSRILAQHLSSAWGQQVVVENRAGNAGLVGAEAAAKSAPDGYTIMLGVVANLSMAPGLHPSTLRYDPVKDFAPITTIANIPIMIAVNPSVPVKNLSELVALARSRPGQLNFGSSGTGGFPHLSGELFKTIAGVNMTHVPYKGSVQAVNDLIGGRIEVIFDYLPSTLPQVKAGRARALAVATNERSPAAPEIPTAIEAGVSNYQVRSWFGILAPAGTPRNIIEKYHGEITRIVNLPEVKSQFASQGAEVFTTSPDEFAQLIKSDVDRWNEVIRQAKIKTN